MAEKSPTKIYQDSPAQILTGSEVYIGDQGNEIGVAWTAQMQTNHSLAQVSDPAIQQFSSVKILSGTLNIPITLITSSADRWLIQLADPDLPSISSFLNNIPSTVTAPSNGTYDLYAWALDSASGKISQVATWSILVQSSSSSTLNAIAVSDPPVDTTTGNITWNIGGNTSNLEYAVQVNSNTVPTVYVTPQPTTVDLSSGNGGVVGVNTVFAWIRDMTTLISSGPQSDAATVTVSGQATASMAVASASLSEERSEVYSIVVDIAPAIVGAGSFDIVATGNANSFLPLITQVNVPDTGTQVVIPLQTVYSQLKLDTQISIQISNGSPNLTIGGVSNMTLTLQSIKGFWSLPASPGGTGDGDIDMATCDFENQLTQYTGSRSQNGGVFSIPERSWIDASADSQNVNALDVSNLTSMTVKNVYIKTPAKSAIRMFTCSGIKIHNVLFEGSARNTTSTANDISAVYALNCQIGNDDFLNLSFRNCHGDMTNWNADGAVNVRILYLFSTGPLGTIRTASFVSFGNSKDIQGGEVDHNVQYSPRLAFGGTAAGGEDVISLQNTRGLDVNNKVSLKHNMVWGGGESISSTCFQVGESGGNFVDSQGNVAIEFSNSGFGLTGGRNNIYKANYAFNSEDKPGKDNAFGMHIRRSGTVTPGSFELNEVSYNRYVSWQKKGAAAATRQDSFYPVDGTDNLTPNHGPGPGETTPTGWGATRSDPGTNTEDANDEWQLDVGQTGYNSLGNRRRVMTQPINNTFLFVENAAHDTALGPGTLSYDGTSLVTWQENGDTVGVGIDLTANNPVTSSPYVAGDFFYVPTGTVGTRSQYKTIRVILKALPSGGSTLDSTIMVTSVPHYKSEFYAGVNGDMT